MEYVEYEIIAIVVLVCLYALFSGLEIAIVGVRRSRAFRFYYKKLSGASALYKLKLNPGRMTAGVNLGNTLVNVAASALATDVSIKLLGGEGVGVAIGIMTFVILVFGEILPKTYCNVNPEKVALRFSKVLLVFNYVLFPIVLGLEHLIKLIFKLCGSHTRMRPITEEEIKEVLDQGLAERAIEKEEHLLVRNALEFDDKPIRDVMTPKDNLFMLEKNMSLADAFSKIEEKGFSKVPVYDKSLNNITGILHIWDVMRIPEKDYNKTKLDKIARKPVFAYTSDRISKLLIELKNKDTHMAIILNENDELEGCITVEDLLEEIVGDIIGEAKNNP